VSNFRPAQPRIRQNSATQHETDTMKPEDLQRLVTVTMPYGKYQGRLIADLPGAYLAWFARKGFPPGELGNLLALMLELDHNGLKPLLDPLRKR
jgi:uncharacterized protein